MVKVFNYDGNSVGVYTGMTNVLTGGTNGASTLTGLTIPILLTQDNIDMGYYSEFDGDIIQQDVATNFVFTGISETEYKKSEVEDLDNQSYSEGEEYGNE